MPLSVSTPPDLVQQSRRNFAVIGVGLVVLGFGVRALADGMVSPFAAASTALSAPRDPDDFLADIAPAPASPVVVMTREDAVAQEILMGSRTMSEAQALRTAQALCEEARLVGFDPLLFLAVIRVESSFNHLALSPVGAEGLMQLMPGTAEFMAERKNLAWPDRHSFDPTVNVRLGVRYLAELNHAFHGSWDLALTAYNRGPHATRVLLQNGAPLPVAVRDFYAGKVMEYYQVLKATYGRLPMA